jgi:porin
MEGDVSIRAGQLAVDDEFATSEYGGAFINAAFGWPAALASDLPSGGNAYPYATPGARLRLGQSKPWSVQAAVFNGDPTGAGHGPGTPQDRDPSGTRFGVTDDALLMLEGSTAINGEENATGLPGTYKLGAWYHTGDFSDPREDTAGGALANPAGTGIGKNRGGNYGIYAVADQMLWHPADDRERGLGLFLRGFLQPGDRNLATFQGDVGLNLKGMLFGRAGDTLGLGFSYVKISDRQRGFDEDNNFFTATNGPLEDHESVIELTYQAQIAPWLILQPDFQYVMHPGGNVADPTDATGLSSIPDAAVFSLRTVVKF